MCWSLDFFEEYIISTTIYPLPHLVTRASSSGQGLHLVGIKQTSRQMGRLKFSYTVPL